MATVIQGPKYNYGGKYRFTLTQDLVVYLNKGWRGRHVLRDDDTEWATLVDDTLTILAGYSCDGCSPAIQLFGHWFGTPTPPNAVTACFVHDVLRGYLGLPCLSYTRKDTDDVFYDILKEAGFKMGEVYHGAVAGFWGSLYIRLTSARPNHSNCKCHPKP